ncbi:hypothetical protein [Nocardia blacklockiae]|uniref:hypothetical protein n=1 Tax=Nocardia blacklockiae TaxID=480036 RepID=UPI0018956DB2|nr:hypothetical protein [Nocardia blacklockiae]MBF6171151.1 hypothetical protein [Nocardia blacklockiae]
MLTLEIKLNRLFELLHERGEPERSTDEVARGASERLGRTIDPAMLVAARAGQLTELPDDVADAVCAEFGSETHYLRSGEDAETVSQDLTFQMWILIRDLGLHRLAARSHELNIDGLRAIVAMLDEIKQKSLSPSHIHDRRTA